MDYLKDYNYFYNKTYAIVETKIKEYLIKANTESRTFNFALNQIIKKDEELLSKKSKIKSNKSLIVLEALHKQSLSQYTVNGIELSLKNEVNKAFCKLNADELPINYSYQKFVGDLGSLYALKEVERLFLNHSSLYQMMFELNDFNDFEIAAYGTFIEEKPIFKLLHKKLYPHNFENASETKFADKVENKKNDAKNKIQVDKAEEELRFNISKFSENDKLFLLHICLNKSYNIPLSESAKIIVITSNIDDLSIFFKETNNCTFYNKLNKGIDQYSGTPQKEFINNIIIKLAPFGLININRIVHTIKSKI